MKRPVSEILCIKSILDLLNDYYPPNKAKNTNGNEIILQHKFTSYFENDTWNICCSDYWIFVSENFKSLKENLITIAQEDNIQVSFLVKHSMAQVIKRKFSSIENRIFIGRTESKILS